MKITQKSNPSLKKAIDEINKKSLRVGWNSESKYENGAFVAGIAAQNEFGNPSKNIPPRPFMRPAMAENGNKWANVIKKTAKQIMNGSGTASSALDLLGQVVAGDIRKSITQVTSPALKYSTIQARLRGRKMTKSSTKPLIDSGIMMNTLTSEIVE